MKPLFKFALLCLLPGALAGAQTVPDATGSAGPHINGNLNYALRYSQSADLRSGTENTQSSVASGTVGYSNESDRTPFALDYSAGYSWTLSGPGYQTGMFQHLTMAGGRVWHKWQMNLSDSVSYLPHSPTVGFSGVPGTGEPVAGSAPAPPTEQSILTVDTHVLENAVSGQVEHLLNYAISFNAGGSSSILRYPDGNGIDTSNQSGFAGLGWRLNARSSLNTNYSYTGFTYPDSSFTFHSQSATLGMMHIWSRKLTSNVAAGPQWTSLSSSSSSTCTPSSENDCSASQATSASSASSALGATVSANATYEFRYSAANVSYSRGVRGGSGYLRGSQSDVLNASFARQMGLKFSASIDGSFSRTAGLQNNGVTYSKYGGAQAAHRLTRYISASVSYTAMSQSSSSALPSNTLRNLMQVFAFGLTYSPRELHIRPSL